MKEKTLYTVAYMPEAQQKKVLVVEDDKPMRETLVEKFKAEGYMVVSAEDGAAGYTVATAEKPDIIVLDILMPHIDGIAMLKKLRQDPWGKDVPVVLLTNLAPSTEEMNEAIATTDPAFFLIKSQLSPGDIVGKVRERLTQQ